MRVDYPRPEDLRVGAVLPGFERTFTSVDLVAYGAATWDWHRLHHDAQYCHALGLSAPVVDGQMFGALFASQATRWAGPRARVLRMDLRLRAMVVAGDTVNAHAEIEALERRGAQTIVTLAQRLLKQDRVCAEAATELSLPGDP